MFIPVLDALDIDAKTITGDALLTQRKLDHYLVEERSAHYVFTAKDNQPSIAEAIRLLFENRGVPDYSEPLTPTHGRIESRSIWTSTVSVRHQSSQAVHPHGCGEHRTHDISSDDKGGSSPRVWGTLLYTVLARGTLRFIPTGVGNTIYADTPPKRVPVHPHGCGEHTNKSDDLIL